MNFIEQIKSRAAENKKTIVLPEGEDIRTLQAAAQILREGFANVKILGNPQAIYKMAEGLDLSRADIINPAVAIKLEEYAKTLYELRKSKGMTTGKAHEMAADPLYQGVLMVRAGDADGMVAGAINSTANVLRPSLQILKTAPGIKLVSSFFVMVVPKFANGEDATFIFSDCGLNIDPTADELADIAITSAESCRKLTGQEARVAMLSYSTMGSGSGESVDKVREATETAKRRAPELHIDGELQADAAVADSVAKLKAPNSDIAGSANVLIFPDLNAGNIGYKLVERLCGAQAYGPITQGIAKPVNDLSRGCSAEDIVGVAAITCLQSQR